MPSRRHVAALVPLCLLGTCVTTAPPAAATTPVSSLTVTLRSDLYAGRGAVVRIGVNGSPVASVPTTSRWRTVTVPLRRSVRTSDEIEIFFADDQRGIIKGVAQDRNLYVRNISVDAHAVAVKATIFDAGSTWAGVIDGKRVKAGAEELTVNGALRFRAPRPTVSAATLAPAASTPASPTATTGVPAAAAAAGFTRPVFTETFANRNSIDLTGTSMAGKRWSTNLPWSQGRTPAGRLVSTAAGLSIDQAVSNQNVALLSMDPRTGQGTTFGHGYFETRMRFDPRKGQAAPGFPAFWLLPKSEMYNQTAPLHHGEIDIFEAYRAGTQAYGGTFVGTVHDVAPLDPKSWTYSTEQNTNNVVPVGIDGGWHTYGVLWQPGRVQWFYDGRRVVDVAYGAGRKPSAPTRNWTTGAQDTTGAFSVLDANARTGMVLMLGTAPQWPIEVSSVRVWAK